MSRVGATVALVFWLTLALAAQNAARVDGVSVSGAGSVLEVEIQTSGAVTPQSQAISGPDRIVVDFPGALPGSDLRALKVNRGVLKAIRSGLFAANPPVTRVVLDLSAPLQYQVFTNRNSVMLKLGATPAAGTQVSGSGAQSAAASPTGQLLPLDTDGENVPQATPEPSMEVSFHEGLLQIHADRVTLAKVLLEVQRQTGAEIAIPAGAEAEEIAAELGPAPAREVLAALLNGSRYNFIFVGNDHGRTLQKAILTVR